MLNLFKKRTIVDDMEAFENQLKICCVIVFKYLMFSFRGHLEKKEFRDNMPEGINENTLAAEVMKYLLPMTNKELNPNIEKLSEENRMLIRHNLPKWADHIMQGTDFAKLIVQTLRMHITFKAYSEGRGWITESKEGKGIGDLLMKYGGLDEESADPKKYKKKIKAWMRWSNIINDNNYKSYFDF